MPCSQRFFLTVTIVFVSSFCFAQEIRQSPTDTFETHLKNSLIVHYSKYPQEKVFVHTNQGVYNAGETIWYKIYAMAYGKPSAISKIIYVQLTDTAGNLITQNKLPLSDGRAHGNIDISQKIKSGWYQLTAFTSWMMNFDRQAYYRQRIYINNPAGSPVLPDKTETAAKSYHITFYPEGGDIVDGNLTTIAFKAWSDDGLSTMVTGAIKDNTNKLLAKIVTVHDGMGEFTIEALAGNAYSATVEFPDGSKQQIKLPVIKTTGMYLQASQTESTIHIKLAFAGVKETFENCVLAAFQNSGQVCTYPIKLLRGINDLELPNSGFVTGILRLTVFDDEGLPQAERILFVNKHDLQASSLKGDTLSSLPGGINAFSMRVKDQAGNPATGNFSVAITDADALKENTSQNIFSGLLLSPELKGEIHDPGYYFENGSDSLARQLDLVMLTNGWRHFSWQKILNKEDYFFTHPAEQSSYLAGKVVNYENLKLEKGRFKIKLLITNQDSTKFFGYISPDSTGRFIIRDFNHTGSSDIYLQTGDKAAHIKNLEIKMFPAVDDSLKQAKAIGFEDRTNPGLSANYILAAKNQAEKSLFANSIVLNTVNVKEKKATPVEKLIAEHVSAKYQSDREYTLDLVNNPTLNIGLIDYIRGRFTNLQVLGDNLNPMFIYLGGNTLMASDGSTAPSLPYFYLDEHLVQDYSFITDISLQDVALIRFMPPPVWFAPYNGGNTGAIMIYTKKNSDEVRKIAGISEFDHYIYNGFSITREFSSTGHSIQPGHTKAGYNGLTLYWNHDLSTDNNGALRFSFNNANAAKKFKITIQGMDAQGRLVYLQQTVQ